MKIETIVSPSSRQELLESYAHLERYVNDGSPSGEKRTVTVNYSPSEGQRTFEVRTVRFSTSEALLIGSAPSETGRRLVLADDETARLYLHPDMAEKYDVPLAEETLEVFPTSSGRTVCVADSKEPAFLKLHYNGMLGRVVRSMNPLKVGESVYFSEELDQAMAQGVDHPRFDFFPESMGMCAPVADEKIGYVTRDFFARKSGRELPVRIPWFSLFSRDQKNPEDVSLLRQWVAYMHPNDHEAQKRFFQENFLHPILDCYVHLSAKVGYISDYNAQNILVVPNAEGNVERLAFRDLHSFYHDTEVRHMRGLQNGYHRKIDTQAADPIDRAYAYQLRSVYFDHKFAEYIVLPAIDAFATGFGFDSDTLVAEARQYLRANFDGIDDYFPAEGYRIPPGITQRNERGQAILAKCEKSKLR